MFDHACGFPSELPTLHQGLLSSSVAGLFLEGPVPAELVQGMQKKVLESRFLDKFWTKRL